jgi:Tol biopolymer transport system component
VASLTDGTIRNLGLIPSGEDVTGLAWSNDGGRLYYSSGPFGGNKSLLMVELEPDSAMPAGPAVSLTTPLTDVIHCALSPVEAQLAVTLNRKERQLWLFDRDPDTGRLSGSGRAVTHRGKQNYYPALSKDGSRLLWTSHVHGNGVLCHKQLGDDESEERVTQIWNHTIRESLGAFVSGDDTILFSSTARGSFEILHSATPRSVAMPVTDTVHPVRDAGPSCNPTRNDIAFYSNRTGNFDIWVMSLDRSSTPRQLTSWSSNEIYPAWSPDGDRIAFRSDRDGNADIWVMDSDGGAPRLLVSHPAEEGWVAWSPDGRWIYFSSNRSGRFDLWVMPTSGGEPRQVTSYGSALMGLPDQANYTRFAVSDTQLVIPLETRSSDIHLVDLRPRKPAT